MPRLYMSELCLNYSSVTNNDACMHTSFLAAHLVVIFFDSG